MFGTYLLGFTIFDEDGNQDKCIYLADNTTIEEETSDEVDRLEEIGFKNDREKTKCMNFTFRRIFTY